MMSSVQSKVIYFVFLNKFVHILWANFRLIDMLSILLSLSVNTDEDEGLYNKNVQNEGRLNVKHILFFYFFLEPAELVRYAEKMYWRCEGVASN